VACAAAAAAVAAMWMLQRSSVVRVLKCACGRTPGLRVLARVHTASNKAAAVAAAAAAVVATTVVATTSCSDVRSSNLPLADRHRVSIVAGVLRNACWEGDGRCRDLRSLLHYLRQAGYEGTETSVGDLMMMFYQDKSPEVRIGLIIYGDWSMRLAFVLVHRRVCLQEAIPLIRAEYRRAGMTPFGANYLITDEGRKPDGTTSNTFPMGIQWGGAASPQGGKQRGPTHGRGVGAGWDHDLRDPDWLAKLRTTVRYDRQIGCQYITFQMFLPPHHQAQGGAYRQDAAYCELVAARIAAAQRVCFDEGLNFYVETHIGRVSEDPSAFVQIFEAAHKQHGCYFEVNGDLSHYIYRGFAPDKGCMPEILGRVQHMHQRMARKHGDLSANVSDPAADWQARGLTWQAFQYSRTTWERGGGLSSRVICGETLGMCDPVLAGKHGVALSLDAKLVPLWRKMCLAADAQIIGNREEDRTAGRSPPAPAGQTREPSHPTRFNPFRVHTAATDGPQWSPH
jgi:hypothetical protein